MKLKKNPNSPIRKACCEIHAFIPNILFIGLGKKAFLFGDQPCEEDCAVFSLLAQFYWHVPGPIGELMKGSCIDLFKVKGSTCFSIWCLCTLWLKEHCHGKCARIQSVTWIKKSNFKQLLPHLVGANELMCVVYISIFLSKKSYHDGYG